MVNKSKVEETPVIFEDNTELKVEETPVIFEDNTELKVEETPVIVEENTESKVEETQELVNDTESKVEETQELVNDTESKVEETQELVNDTESKVEDDTEQKEINPYGTLNNCARLYVRKEPDKDSEPVLIINDKDNVIIKSKESTDEFYKVEVKGISGYCMKKFIKIS